MRELISCDFAGGDRRTRYCVRILVDMQVMIEPPQDWGPKRLMITELHRLGYRVTEIRYPGEARSLLVVT